MFRGFYLNLWIGRSKCPTTIPSCINGCCEALAFFSSRSSHSIEWCVERPKDNYCVFKLHALCTRGLFLCLALPSRPENGFFCSLADKVCSQHVTMVLRLNSLRHETSRELTIGIPVDSWLSLSIRNWEPTLSAAEDWSWRQPTDMWSDAQWSRVTAVPRCHCQSKSPRWRDDGHALARLSHCVIYHMAVSF